MSLDERENAILETLVSLTAGRRLATFEYMKPWEERSTDRTAEVYDLMESSGNLMVRAWQIKPDLACPNCWRCFRLDRIMQVVDGGTTFEPRRPASICDGELKPFKAPAKKASKRHGDFIEFIITANGTDDDLKGYKRLIESAIADDKLTQPEIDLAYTEFPDLGDDRRRVAHAQIYIAALNEVTMDGAISDAESDYLGRVRKHLGVLGWAP